MNRHALLFDHLVGERQKRAQAFSGLEVDHQSKLARLLNRQIPGSGTTEDFRD
jgi:hypothetical protein